MESKEEAKQSSTSESVIASQSVAPLAGKTLAMTEEQLRFQIAMSYSYLGQIYVNAHRPDLAIASTQKAIVLLEQLPGDMARGNLAATLGDLANAYIDMGKFDVAKEANERALGIYRELKKDREVASNLGRGAFILLDFMRNKSMLYACSLIPN